MSKTILHAELRVQGCEAELYLNDIPLVRLDAKKSVAEVRAVEAYVISGANWLEILVMPGRSPSTARSERRVLELKGAKARARLYRLRPGEWTDSAGHLLGEVVYDSDAAAAPGVPPEGERMFPQSRAAQIDLGAANGRWSWQDAPELSLGPALVTEATAVLERIKSALERGMVDELWALQELQTKDAVRAYPALTEAHARSEMADSAAHYHKRGAAQVGLDPEAFDFRLVAGGRMLDCVDRDGLPSLRLTDPDSGLPVPYEVMLARIDGRLRVVR